jgi:hypothetical protein
MSAVDTSGVWEALRKPFPPNRIGKLPRAINRDEAKKGHCPECGKWHGLPAIHLDYVGHGAVTERLLEVDPAWNWEPLALGADGTPLVLIRGDTAELWIRLTVAAVTRLGVGTVPKAKSDLAKELISDAIRNAAMRFGVALDLWIKGDSEDSPDESPVVSPAQRLANALAALAEGDLDMARRLSVEGAKALGLAGRWADDESNVDDLLAWATEHQWE